MYIKINATGVWQVWTGDLLIAEFSSYEDAQNYVDEHEGRP